MSSVRRPNPTCDWLQVVPEVNEKNSQKGLFIEHRIACHIIEMRKSFQFGWYDLNRMLLFQSHATQFYPFLNSNRIVTEETLLRVNGIKFAQHYPLNSPIEFLTLMVSTLGHHFHFILGRRRQRPIVKISGKYLFTRWFLKY